MIDWEKFRDGNMSAFKLLYDEYADKLFAYGMKLVPNETLVSECIQNLFVYIFEKRHTISEPTSVGAYLCVSLKRMILREKTRTNLFVSNTDENNEYSFGMMIDTDNTIIKTESDKERADVLQKVLDSLSSKQREIIYLKFYNEMNNEEISNVMGISNQSVRNLLSETLKKLREKGELKAIASFLFILNKLE